MHELPIIKTICRLVLEKAEAEGVERILNVYLEVGVLRDFIPSYMKKYWSYVTKGTIAEDSSLLIREIPATARCGKCGRVYDVDMDDLEGSVCPDCGYEKGSLLTGRELNIFGIQVAEDENEDSE